MYVDLQLSAANVGCPTSMFAQARRQSPDRSGSRDPPAMCSIVSGSVFRRSLNWRELSVDCPLRKHHLMTTHQRHFPPRVVGAIRPVPWPSKHAAMNLPLDSPASRHRLAGCLLHLPHPCVQSAFKKVVELSRRPDPLHGKTPAKKIGHLAPVPAAHCTRGEDPLGEALVRRPPLRIGPNVAQDSLEKLGRALRQILVQGDVQRF